MVHRRNVERRNEGGGVNASSKEEKKIFNSFMRDHPKPTSKTWLDMAELFKGKADYKTVFPKLTSMLRAHYYKWKVTQELKMIKASIHEKYYALLKELGIPTETQGGSNPAGVFQKESSQPTEEERTGTDDPNDNSASVVPVNNFDDAPEDPHNVAPMGTAGQHTYNPSIKGTSKAGLLQRCFLWMPKPSSKLFRDEWGMKDLPVSHREE